MGIQGNGDKPCEAGFKEQVQRFGAWVFLDVFKSTVAVSCLYRCVFYDSACRDRAVLPVFVCGFGAVDFFQYLPERGTTVIFSQQDMVKKIYFPREALPLSFTISQFINMLLSFAVIFLVVLLSGRGLHLRALAFLPLVMAAEFLLALGTVYFVSALNVYFRDLEHILGIVSMAWMYLTPVLYSLDMVPQQYVGLFYFNPMTAVIISYRKILYDGVPPHMDTLLGSLAVGAAVLLAGQAAFGRLQRHFAEEL